MDAAPERATTRPATAARIYDFLLGGVYNFPADREVAQKLIAGMPSARMGARANRAFLGRAVRYLVDQGIDQFVDIGSGIPTEGNVHQIAQRANPQVRVAYVDIDPLAVAESLDVLDGDPRATAVCGDLRQPQAILDHPEINRLIDLSRPAGLILNAVLHFIPDDEQAYGAVRLLQGALVPGSYMGLSHGATETAPREEYESVERAYDQRTMTGLAKPRDHAEVAQFFTGWDLVEPGLVWLSEWRPDPGQSPEFEDPTISVGWAGVARKP